MSSMSLLNDLLKFSSFKKFNTVLNIRSDKNSVLYVFKKMSHYSYYKQDQVRVIWEWKLKSHSVSRVFRSCIPPAYWGIWKPYVCKLITTRSIGHCDCKILLGISPCLKKRFEVSRNYIPIFLIDMAMVVSVRSCHGSTVTGCYPIGVEN